LFDSTVTFRIGAKLIGLAVDVVVVDVLDVVVAVKVVGSIVDVVVVDVSVGVKVVVKKI